MHRVQTSREMSQWTSSSDRKATCRPQISIQMSAKISLASLRCSPNHRLVLRTTSSSRRRPTRPAISRARLHIKRRSTISTMPMMRLNCKPNSQPNSRSLNWYVPFRNLLCAFLLFSEFPLNLFRQQCSPCTLTTCLDFDLFTLLDCLCGLF